MLPGNQNRYVIYMLFTGSYYNAGTFNAIVSSTRVTAVDSSVLLRYRYVNYGFTRPDFAECSRYYMQ